MVRTGEAGRKPENAKGMWFEESRSAGLGFNRTGRSHEVGAGLPRVVLSVEVGGGRTGVELRAVEEDPPATCSGSSTGA